MIIIERPVYVNKLISKMDNGMIKVITGIRRCGKSFLLFELFYNYLLEQGIAEDCIIRIALDDVKNEALLDPQYLSEYISDHVKDTSSHYYVLIDEIQFAITRDELKNKDEYVRLYGVLKGLLRRKNVDVYVTGSNSKLLSTDVMTEFRGRGDRIHIAPLAFAEYYPAHGGTKEEAWNDYLLFGGMPYAVSLSEEDKVKYLTELHSEIYIKDISERYGISNSSGMDDLQKVLASAVSSLTNPQKIADTFKSAGMKGISAQIGRAHV